MKNGVSIVVMCGLIGLILITIAILQFWEKWRKRAIIEAGKALGFQHLAQGETLPVVLVPLINPTKNKYFVILRGEINGYEAGYFDLFYWGGKKLGFYYSTIIRQRTGSITMSKLQLKPSDWVAQY